MEHENSATLEIRGGFVHKTEPTKGDYKKLTILSRKSIFNVFVPKNINTDSKYLHIRGNMVNKFDKERKTFNTVVFVNKDDEKAYARIV